MRPQLQLRQNNPSRKGMLFLRRKLGEQIVIFDRLSELWIRVVDIDPEQMLTTLDLGVGKPTELGLHETLPILQGDGQIQFHALQEYQDGTCEVGLGIHAPQSMLIRREELVKGTTRDQRAAMLR